VTDPAVSELYRGYLRRERDTLRAVLPKGARLRIEMRRMEVAKYPTVELESVLSMGMGKGGKLECRPVPCRLIYSAEDSAAPEKEAARIRVSTDKVSASAKGVIYVQAISLNQAYTIASRRFEEWRASHTGNIYTRLALLLDGNGVVPLYDIRSDAESGSVPYMDTEETKT